MRVVPARQLHERFDLDRALLIGYVVCCALEFVLLPLDGGVDWGEVGPALALQVLVGLLLFAGRNTRVERVRWLGVAGVVVYLFSVALLRDGASPTAGFGPLVLLPVVWASLRGSRLQLWVAVVGVAVVYLVPTIAIGPPQYPAGGWRAGLLFAVISAALGWAVIQLVERVRELVERLDGLARTDPLTGLPNRRGWQESLDRELSAASRTGQPLSVVFFDLDLFKTYNDANGHLAGDRLLLHAAASWQSVLRGTDVLARWGGDEFGLLLPSCDGAQGRALVERMRSRTPDAPFSAGVVEWDRKSSAEGLIDAADTALYGAKAASRT
jgi:diguanylate cyclase (GGDEF)-like protein